ncbi:MAG: 23S rRNA (guanosine(2251)-2'-O)-methyltransferase RlmB [Rhizobiaceae bacterium]|nr:23S rRNA (guanosine(2251)-2'-O)-methyltransferase RlmB [Rhizobiaceae bacterium]
MKSPRPPARKHSRNTSNRGTPRSGSDGGGGGASAGRSRPKRKGGNRSSRSGAGSGDSLLLYGLHTVRAALNNPDRRIEELYVTENGLDRLGQIAPHRKALPVSLRSGQALDQLVGGEAVHQGVVAKCLPLDMLDASELFHLAEAKLVLVLDQITDPHNAGAILRSASALGADAVLTTSRNSVHETAVLAKSACGALDTIRLIELRNLSKGLQELNDMGFYSIGLDSEGPLVLEETLASSGADSIVLVLGSENKGLRQMTRETCKALARLDMPGPIKSLNVSNAATLSLYAVANHLRPRS